MPSGFVQHNEGEALGGRWDAEPFRLGTGRRRGDKPDTEGMVL